MSDINHAAVGLALKNGDGITKALIAGGYSEKVAKQGWVVVNKSGPLRLAIAEEMGRGWQKLVNRGQAVSAENLKLAILGRVAQNLEEGSDAGVQSAKLAGSWKALNMWTADNQLGVIVVTGGAMMPTIEAEIVEPGLLTEGETETPRDS